MNRFDSYQYKKLTGKYMIVGILSDMAYLLS
jgi:hypothetical protein